MADTQVTQIGKTMDAAAMQVRNIQIMSPHCRRRESASDGRLRAPISSLFSLLSAFQKSGRQQTNALPPLSASGRLYRLKM